MIRYARSILIALALMVVSATAVLGHQITDLSIDATCRSWNVTVNYTDFASDRHIKGTVLVDNVVIEVDITGLSGSGTVAVAGDDALAAEIDVVLQVFDGEQTEGDELTGSGGFEGTCEQPTPTPRVFPSPRIEPCAIVDRNTGQCAPLDLGPFSTPAPLVLLPDTAIEAPTTTQTAALLLLVVLVGGLLYLARKDR